MEGESMDPDMGLKKKDWLFECLRSVRDETLNLIRTEL